MNHCIKNRKPGYFEKIGENYARGSRNAISRLIIGALLMPLPIGLAIGSQSAHAAEIPKSTGADPRIGELAYDRNDIFQIRVGMGIATQIVLADGERIVASAPGSPADCRDGVDWCIVAKSGSNELFVQPRTGAALRNNLQLTTSLRRYSFEFLQSSSQSAAGPWYRVTFRYAPDMTPGATPSCNWGYTMTAPPPGGIAVPLAIFDDGHRTYLVLPPGSAASRPTVVASEGGLRMLAGGPGRDVMVLDGVADNFELRAGRAALSVWNEGLRPGAPRGACPMW